MNIKLMILPIFMLGIIVACSEMNPHPMDMTQAGQNASTAADHETLAEHYEAAAKDMQAKADEHKKLLAQYEAKSYLYGRQAINLKMHCEALINAYEKAVEANSGMASMHRQMVK